MPNVVISLTNAQTILTKVNALKTSIIDLTPAFRSIGESLLFSHAERARQEISPTGNKWAPNRPYTIEMYWAKRGYKKGSRPKTKPKILRDSGTLLDTMTYKVSSNSVIFGTSMAASGYAYLMQYGAKKNRSLGIWGDIPARPFIGFSATDKTYAMLTISNYIRKQQEKI